MKVHLVLLSAALRGLRMLYLVADKRRRQEAEPVISRGSLRVYSASRKEVGKEGITFCANCAFVQK